MDIKLKAAITAATCVTSIDDTKQLVTVTLPAGLDPSQAIIRQWHETAGDLGYGLRIKAE